jgi:hypothetical protein
VFRDLSKRLAKHVYLSRTPLLKIPARAALAGKGCFWPPIIGRFSWSQKGTPHQHKICPVTHEPLPAVLADVNMCWVCDSMAPECPHVDADAWDRALLSIGLVPARSGSSVAAGNFPELNPCAIEAFSAQQCQAAEEDKEAAPRRAPPLDRTLFIGTNSAAPRARAERVHWHALMPNACECVRRAQPSRQRLQSPEVPLCTGSRRANRCRRRRSMDEKLLVI